MNRGSHPSRPSPGLRGQASMRPRFMNRGSPTGFAQQYHDLIASMRPRFMNRGSGEKALADAPEAVRLQ